eukprot:1117659-Ditylum_brightwellii.AAC.1
MIVKARLTSISSNLFFELATSRSTMDNYVDENMKNANEVLMPNKNSIHSVQEENVLIPISVPLILKFRESGCEYSKRKESFLVQEKDKI